MGALILPPLAEAASPLRRRRWVPVISLQEYVSRLSNVHESALTEGIREIVCKSRCTCMKRLYGTAYPFVKKEVGDGCFYHRGKKKKKNVLMFY